MRFRTIQCQANNMAVDWLFEIDTAISNNACCSAGRYVRSNLNMPPGLPLWGDKRDYDMDAPITVLGNTQARLVGESPVPDLPSRKTHRGPPVAVHSWNVSSRRRGPARKQHSHRLRLLLSVPALRADGTEHPEGWEQMEFFNVHLRHVSVFATGGTSSGVSCPRRSAAGRQAEGESGAGPLWMDQVGLWEFFACVDSSRWAGRCQLQCWHNLQVTDRHAHC